MTPFHPPSADAKPPAPARPRGGWVDALWHWRTVLVLFYGGIAVVFVGFAGSIAMNALRNHGLVPPPSTLARYDCTGANAPLVFMYLHGTERVKISTATGVLEGTLLNNQLDWGSFGSDASQIGFVPPTGISDEDAQALTLQGPGAFTMRCTRTAPASVAAPAKQSQ